MEPGGCGPACRTATGAEALTLVCVHETSPRARDPRNFGRNGGAAGRGLRESGSLVGRSVSGGELQDPGRADLVAGPFSRHHKPRVPPGSSLLDHRAGTESLPTEI